MNCRYHRLGISCSACALFPSWHWKRALEIDNEENDSAPEEWLVEHQHILDRYNAALQRENRKCYTGISNERLAGVI